MEERKEYSVKYGVVVAQGRKKGGWDGLGEEQVEIRRRLPVGGSPQVSPARLTILWIIPS